MNTSGVLSLFVWLYLKFLWVTCRVEIKESESFTNDLNNKKPILLAHWHGDELMLLRVVKRYRLCTMVSLSKDGELMTKLIMRLGGQASRGSSSRGGVAALKGLIRLIRNGNVGSVAVDGPRGPIYKVKPGIFEVAKLAKAKIYTLSAATTKPKVFEKSWNKAVLPKPFGTIYISVGEHHLELDRTESAKDPKFAKTLEFQLTDAKQKVSKLIANF